MSERGRSDGVLCLRPFVMEDVPALVEAARESRAEVGRWLPWCHADYGPSDAEAWVALAQAQRESAEGYHDAVVDVASGALLGGCGLWPLNRTHGLANLGYWVRTGAAGRGVATRAARLAAQQGFELGLTRLEIIAAVGNVASLRVAQKLGAQREGVLRNRLVIHGGLHDAVCFSLVPGDLADDGEPRRQSPSE